MSRSVGIDLGTTNSVVAVLGGPGSSGDGTTPQIIPLSEGSNLCPSVVGFTRAGGERVVGHLAKRQAITNPERTITSIKRQMGTAFRATIDGHAYSPEEISATILEKLRRDAEDYLGDTIEEAVITVPAYFSNAQREATKTAGEIAGISVVRIINEPTAAALAYGSEVSGLKTLLVWDLGGGTFDVSILDISDGETFEVCATCGDTRLGGDDWDDRIVEHLIMSFADAHPNSPSAQLEAVRSNLVAMQRIRDAAEKAKIELSTVATAAVNLPFLASDAGGAAIHLEAQITRAQFEEMTRDLLERMISPTEKAMLDAKLDRNKIDRILLVGGSTRMPAVQHLIRTMFDKEPYKGLNPDEAVAAGAAIQAGIIHGSVTDLVLIDVTPLTLGIETQGGVFTGLIERNSAIPTSHAQLFTTALDNQGTVDIHVLQGEREFAADNMTLGKFKLTGLPPAPRGTPRIEVCFDIDTNGIVNVSAMDLATNRKQQVTITASSGLSRREVDKMVDEAQTSRVVDAKRRQETETKNKAEHGIYTAKSLMADAKNKVPASQLQKLASASKTVQDGLSRGDLAFVRRATENLDDAIADVSRSLYELAAV